MGTYAIRNLHSHKEIPPMFCEYRRNGDGKEYFRVRDKDKEYRDIAVEDFLYQLKVAREMVKEF